MKLWSGIVYTKTMMEITIRKKMVDSQNTLKTRRTISAEE